MSKKHPGLVPGHTPNPLPPGVPPGTPRTGTIRPNGPPPPPAPKR